MWSPLLVRRGLQGLALVLLAALLGCSDDETFHITNVIPEHANRAPAILEQGPEWSFDAPLELGPDNWWTAPNPWILVGDADGLDDISMAFFTIDSVRVSETVVRPDTTPPSLCAVPSRSTTLDFEAVLSRSYGGVQNAPMARGDGGLFGATDGSGGPFSLGGLVYSRVENASAFIGRRTKGCAGNGGIYLTYFSARPPLVPVTIDVFLMAATVEFIGISATVYDAAGDTAVTRFPNLRVRFAAENPPTP